MAKEIVTPLTQALSEGKLTREELKSFMRRSDWPALRLLVVWIVVLCMTSSLIYMSWDSWLIWPAMFIHGIVIVHHFSLEHECVHYTVFRTRRLNDIAGYICGLILVLPFKHFRYEHCDHHTYTQLEGEDPELVPMPQNLGQYLYYISAVPYWRTKLTELVRHVFGRLTDEEKRFVPEVEQKTIYLEARLMAAFYVLVFGYMFATGWYDLIWYWFIPLLLGEPVMRFVRMTEHVGRPTVAQMHENTRTNIVSLPWRFLCWNMNYHAEHHYASSVPFHALPRLHEKLKGHIYVEKGGYIGAHKDILTQLFSKSEGK
ncbi:fatty acid desaturase family protein [Cochlodiniinecator piscidefendens]|uniref:fatty acid desaturase family protein n=1 Tax=Cochlodiniinecator piscidefendens TaxID=2715756 RepID=UPI00140D7B8F|nr:fatty acid desaturase family protein [Cochlodiniinecator piscidefendens]